MIIQANPGWFLVRFEKRHGGLAPVEEPVIAFDVDHTSAIPLTLRGAFEDGAYLERDEIYFTLGGKRIGTVDKARERWAQEYE